MNKRFILVILSIILSCAVMAQDSAVVMRVAGLPVTMGEVRYAYHQAQTRGGQQKSIAQFAQHYASFRLKVQAALDDGLDTMLAIRREYRTYRDMLVKPLLVPQPHMERECQAYYRRMQANMEGHDVIQPAHIFLRLPQQATAQIQAATKARIDSMYQALQQGKDFAQLAAEVSQDSATAARGGVLAWMGPKQSLPEFEKVAYSLEKGEISQPFLSTVGYHIVKLMDRKPLEPYDELRPRIARYLETKGLAARLAEQAIDSMATDSAVGASVEEILDHATAQLCDARPELRYQMQDYHHGLLVYEVCNRRVWTTSATDTAGLRSYFKKHKRQYAWSRPHYHGMIYYCRTKTDVKAVKKAIKRLPPAQWQAQVDKRFNADSICVKVEQGLFEQGDNRNIDILALKTKKGTPTPVEGFPYLGLVGDKLKKGPKQWTDVAADVVADYQRQREDEFVASLRQKYTVEIDEAVLQQMKNEKQ